MQYSATVYTTLVLTSGIATIPSIIILLGACSPFAGLSIRGCVPLQDHHWPTFCCALSGPAPVSTSENRTIRRPAWIPVSHPAKTLSITCQEAWEALWVRSTATVQMMDKAGRCNGCVNHRRVGVTTFSLAARDRTHFMKTMIAKIFMTNKKMGLGLPPPPPPRPLRLLCAG